MFTNRRSPIWKFFQHDKFFSMDFPELDKNAVVHCSKHGWLLMSRDDETLFFFDPFSNRSIEVPKPPGNFEFKISFFHPPTSPDCFLIGIDGGVGLQVTIGLLRHGQDKWDIDFMDNISRRVEFQPSLSPPIFHGERLYFLDVGGKVATLDMSEDRLRKGSIVKSGCIFSKCLKQRKLHENIEEHFLVRSEGEDAIFAVFVMHDKGKARVFRLLEYSDMLWEPVEDLGDRVFYVSNASSFGYTTSNKSMTNKIFFPKFHGDDKVVFYSLESHKYHSFGGNYSSKNSYAFKRFDHATWMMLAPILPQGGELLTWCP